jgi:recombinase
MSNSERIHEAVDGTLDAQYVKAREAAGWRLVGVEWERGVGAAQGAGVEAGGARVADQERERNAPVTPLGWRAVPEGSRLEEDPEEMQFLFAVMELMIQDISITKVAEELNRRGFRTRGGNAWGPVAVFNLLPRLVELTPRIFRSEEWVERRKNLTPVF